MEKDVIKQINYYLIDIVKKIMEMIDNKYVRIEIYLEKCIRSSLKFPNADFTIGIKDTLLKSYQEYPPLIRVGIGSLGVNKEAQKVIKQFFKDTFGLDKVYLERECSNSDTDILYEIVYKVSKELFEKFEVLSKID